jgi:hypothetical protein
MNTNTTNNSSEETSTSNLFRGLGVAAGVADGFSKGSGLTRPQVNTHLFRPMASQIFINQILPQLRDPQLHEEDRARIILALARRLHCDASRYVYLPWNWWRMQHIFESRRLYEALINYGLIHDIVLTETSW